MIHPRADDRIIPIRMCMYGRIESAVDARNDALAIARHDERFRRTFPPLDERSAHNGTFVAGYDFANRSVVVWLSRLDRILLSARWEEGFANYRILEQIEQVRDTTPEVGFRGSSQSRHKVTICSAAIRPVFVR